MSSAGKGDQEEIDPDEVCRVCALDAGVEEYEYRYTSEYRDDVEERTVKLCGPCARVTGIEHIDRPMGGPGSWDTKLILLYRVLHEMKGGMFAGPRLKRRRSQNAEDVLKRMAHGEGHGAD